MTTVARDSVTHRLFTTESVQFNYDVVHECDWFCYWFTNTSLLIPSVFIDSNAAMFVRGLGLTQMECTYPN